MEIHNKIDYWLERASNQHLSNGIDWYQTTKEWCKTVAIQFNTSEKKVAGILSALSPMKEFGLNQQLTIEFLECQDCGHLSKQKEKCKLIYSGVPNDKYIMATLQGRKTKSFYHNICYPIGSDFLTVDFRIWKFFKKDEWEHITNNRWDQMEFIFRKKSSELDLSLPQLQAILWLVTKEYGKFNTKSKKAN